MMQARLTTKPQHEVIAAIQALDLEAIKLRMMDTESGEGWTRAYADRVEGQYKHFLTMLVRHPDDIQDILVSKDVDEFWHNHILHTMKYAADCQNVFGNFLHHNPQLPPKSTGETEKRRASAEKTRRMYEQDSQHGHETAYCNATAHIQPVAYCNASTRIAAHAYCNASVEPRAYCNAMIRADRAAYCNAVASQEAAYCNASASARKASYCNASIEKLAYCNAAVFPASAYCNASLSAETAAYCNASAGSDNAYCNAAAQQAAYCNAMIKGAYCNASAEPSHTNLAYCNASAVAP